MNLHNTKFYLFVFIFFCLFFSASTIYTGTVPLFTIITEEWEPYNFKRDGTVKGISTDLLVLMLKRVGSTQGRIDIKLFPWARAYKTIQEEPNTLLFTTTRTEEREKMFKWVGPIFEIEFHVYALKKRNIKINTFQELRKYKIGTLRGDVTEDLLIKKAGMEISDFDQVSSNIQNTRKLLIERVDLVAHSKDTTISTCKELGINPYELESVITLDKKSMYYAFHKETPDSVIKIFQTVLDDIKKEGKLAEIFHRYGK